MQALHCFVLLPLLSSSCAQPVHLRTTGAVAGTPPQLMAVPTHYFKVRRAAPLLAWLLPWRIHDAKYAAGNQSYFLCYTHGPMRHTTLSALPA